MAGLPFPGITPGHETGINVALLTLTPTGGQADRRDERGPATDVFPVFDVPASFRTGAVTIAGAESGGPAIRVLTPVTFPVAIGH